MVDVDAIFIQPASFYGTKLVFQYIPAPLTEYFTGKGSQLLIGPLLTSAHQCSYSTPPRSDTDSSLLHELPHTGQNLIRKP